MQRKLLLVKLLHIYSLLFVVSAYELPGSKYASEGAPLVFFHCIIDVGTEYMEWGWLRGDSKEVIIKNSTLACSECSAGKYLVLQFTDDENMFSILLIYNVQLEDDGRYDCYLNNTDNIVNTYDLYVGNRNKSVLEGGHSLTYDVKWPTIGGSLNLTCSMPPRKLNITAVWRREDYKPLQISSIESENGTNLTSDNNVTDSRESTGKVLSLRDINENHTGEYECSVEPWGLTTVINVNVHGSPIATINVSTLSAILGSEVSLRCEVQGFLLHHLYWTQNGKRVQLIPGKVEEDFNNLKWNGFEYYLIVRNLTVEDFGEYSCEAGNDQGISRSPTVTLSEAEAIPTHIPIVVGRQSEKYATAGHPVLFQCKFERLGNHKILWKNSTTIFAENTKFLLPVSERWNLTQNENRWSFHIYDVRTEEEGSYTCFVKGKRWIGQTIKLSVNNMVNIERLEDVVALEGETLDLFCNATGFPPPTVKWARSDGAPLRVRRIPVDLFEMNVQVSAWPEAVLPLQPLQKKDAGRYYCLAENEKILEGNKRHTAEPNVTAVEPRLSARLDTTAVLECTIEAVPTPKVLWDANGATLKKSLRNVQNISLNLDGKYTATLTIRRIRATDMQTYRCIARNSVGESAAEIVLTSSSTRARPNENVMITAFYVSIEMGIICWKLSVLMQYP